MRMIVVLRYMNLIRANAIWLFALLGFIVVSCADKEPQQETGLVTLFLKVETNGDNGIPEVRDGSTTNIGIPGESAIDRLKVFVFNTATNMLEQYASIQIVGGSSSDPMWDSTQSALRMVITPGAKRIYCIANWIDGSSGMPALTNLSVQDSTTLVGTIRAHSAMLANPPVMSGRLATTLAGSEMSLTIPMERQVARVEIYPVISRELKFMGANILLNRASFQSMADRTFLFRQFPRTGPSSLTPWNQSGFSGPSTPLALDTLPAIVANRPMLDIYYYTPENLSSVQTDATWVTLEATYNTELVYYGLFINPTDYGNHRLYTLERNHTYKMYITIQGKGSTTAPTAATRSADGNLHNLTYETVIQ